MKASELKIILKTKTPKEIFGEKPKKVYKQFAKIAHPDAAGGSNELFILLNELYARLDGGITISSKNGVYKVDEEPYIKVISLMFILQKTENIS